MIQRATGAMLKPSSHRKHVKRKFRGACFLGYLGQADGKKGERRIIGLYAFRLDEHEHRWPYKKLMFHVNIAAKCGSPAGWENNIEHVVLNTRQRFTTINSHLTMAHLFSSGGFCRTNHTAMLYLVPFTPTNTTRELPNVQIPCNNPYT